MIEEVKEIKQQVKPAMNIQKEELKQEECIEPEPVQASSTVELTPSLNYLDSVIKTFLPKTRCQITNEMRAFLIKLLGNKPVTLTLLYSGHLHGWNKKDFHDRCDSKGRTVSLFQIEQGDCIGGYTSQCWDKSGWYKADSSAFLFNLTRSRHFPSKATGLDIYCNSYNGPCFKGDDLSDLAARYDPFNTKDYCSSWANKPGY